MRDLRHCSRKTGAVKLDAAGKPLAKVVVDLHFFLDRNAAQIHKEVHRANFVETDADGRFQFDNVIPGPKFMLWLAQGKRQLEEVIEIGPRSVAAGAVLDIGEVKLKPKTENES
jgi:hypothetical protein